MIVGARFCRHATCRAICGFDAVRPVASEMSGAEPHLSISRGHRIGPLIDLHTRAREVFTTTLRDRRLAALDKSARTEQIFATPTHA